MLEDTFFLGAKPLQIPMDPNVTLIENQDEPLEDSTMNKKLIGRLMYLTISRPDMNFSVNRLSQLTSKPCKAHLLVVHQILEYLKSSPDLGLMLLRTSSLKVSVYVDADWGSCPTTRKLTPSLCLY